MSIRDNLLRLTARTGKLVTSSGAIVNEADVIRSHLGGRTVFNEQIVTQRSSVFNLSSIFPLSMFRDVVTGTVNNFLDEYEITPGATIETAQLGVYVTGHAANAGTGMRFDPNNMAEGRWGYYNDLDGFFFERTAAEGFRLGIRRGGITQYIERANWLDRLDGEGPSGLNIDLSQGYIFEIDFAWYGHGPIVWKVLPKEGTIGVQPTLAVMHVAFVDGGTTSKNANLPITVENFGTTGNMYLTGRQYSIYGPYETEERSTGRSSGLQTISDTWTPIISFRRQTTGSIYTLRGGSYDIINTSVENAELQLILNPTLTTPTPVAPDNRSAGETAVEFDISSTSFTGGESFGPTKLLQASGRTQPIAKDVGLDTEIPRDYWVTLVGRTFGTGATADVIASLNAVEEW